MQCMVDTLQSSHTQSTSTLRDVAEFYGEITYPGLGAKPNYHLVERLRPYLQPGSRVLDAGCGTGHLLLGLALIYREREYFGVDISERSIGIARELFSHHGVPASFAVGDFNQPLPFSGTFDVIISYGTIHHNPDPPRALRNLCEYLTPTGIMCLMLYSTRSHRERLMLKELLHLLEPSDSMRRFHLYRDYLHHQTPSFLQQLLAVSPAKVLRGCKQVHQRVVQAVRLARSGGIRGPIRKLDVYNQFYRDAFDVPIEHTYDTWSIQALLDGAGLEVVEHLGITRERRDWLPSAWRDCYDRLGSWEQARVMELLNPVPASFSLIVRKQQEMKYREVAASR